MKYELTITEPDTTDKKETGIFDFETPYQAFDFLRKLAATYRICKVGTVTMGGEKPSLSVYRTKILKPESLLFTLTLNPIA